MDEREVSVATMLLKKAAAQTMQLLHQAKEEELKLRGKLLRMESRCAAAVAALDEDRVARSLKWTEKKEKYALQQRRELEQRYQAEVRSRGTRALRPMGTCALSSGGVQADTSGADDIHRDHAPYSPVAHGDTDTFRRPFTHQCQRPLRHMREHAGPSSPSKRQDGMRTSRPSLPPRAASTHPSSRNHVGRLVLTPPVPPHDKVQRIVEAVYSPCHLTRSSTPAFMLAGGLWSDDIPLLERLGVVARTDRALPYQQQRASTQASRSGILSPPSSSFLSRLRKSRIPDLQAASAVVKRQEAQYYLTAKNAESVYRLEERRQRAAAQSRIRRLKQAQELKAEAQRQTSSAVVVTDGVRCGDSASSRSSNEEEEEHGIGHQERDEEKEGKRTDSHRRETNNANDTENSDFEGDRRLAVFSPTDGELNLDSSEDEDVVSLLRTAATRRESASAVVTVAPSHDAAAAATGAVELMPGSPPVSLVQSACAPASPGDCGSGWASRMGERSENVSRHSADVQYGGAYHFMVNHSKAHGNPRVRSLKKLSVVGSSVNGILEADVSIQLDAVSLHRNTTSNTASPLAVAGSRGGKGHQGGNVDRHHSGTRRQIGTDTDAGICRRSSIHRRRFAEVPPRSITSLGRHRSQQHPHPRLG